MSAFITETWLREHFSLAPGTEVHLPAEGRLTPAAHALLAERHVAVRYVDAAGRNYVEPAEAGGAQAAAGEPARVQVHPLTGRSGRQPAACALCGQEVARKPEAMTHLDERRLVAKNDPRLRLRGALDTAIAWAVWVQAELPPEERDTTLGHWLADVRSCLGNVLRGEVTGEPVSELRMGELDDEAIHRVSHDPLRYFGHDHLVPDAAQGVTVARLNLLRAQIRAAELAAAELYIDRDYAVARPDILQALNRLSSAVYVLMLLARVAALGQAADLGKPVTWT
ncbi:ethanolamine utilization cob(I)yrinic acid a,c-diamide adenosyltransferase EutT [Pseudothauera rhizosphaerae]|uniref:Ethanolamine utilization cob(I)yrinic acid a,c-diamide adenosyltransferase EutT n=1 Tax=Pseudothauera rhizosphaerae TaxID=2565932 RepID=A0A4S4AIV5_9RHOO|nr:ethanolamine utilization cob(I)yrinic acid a,c-diamide adenosyltransferase EutT [Pseudothauera rhizosphaerae]THF59304.1 ethanolamine utilization cob(I)yrinic acid a,c-diamide adenosyltransferase EutT [Pseudothauera rhizosphaerae]